MMNTIINSPRNAMTLLCDLHIALGMFSMAFEETISSVHCSAYLAHHILQEIFHRMAWSVLNLMTAISHYLTRPS